MCPVCDGIGEAASINVDRLVDRNLSLNEGALLLPGWGVDTWYWQIFTLSGFFDNDKKLRDYTEAEWDRFLNGHRPHCPVASRSG
jgi:excinuclease UvrABC ATPase subunit